MSLELKTNENNKKLSLQEQNIKMMPSDSPLSLKVKGFAMNELNADLVGIANIERFKNAPKRMCPQGLMPEARSVIVMAVTHLDGTVEIGGKFHPQELGPYWIQFGMSNRLDEMAYRMALQLESLGFKAAPVASSNIWRFDGYKEMTEQFAPDVSHMHCAVAAGLADFGYTGLAITPEYGARQRFITIVTDAELTPTPLLEPGSVCDNCMLCRKHCMTQALSKEIKGWNIIKIEDKEYRYANKNLWRCSWGEHFGLSLDIDLPDKVDKQVILENLHKHGKRGGAMGSCLRYCVPKELRYFDREYSSTPRRKKHTLANPETPIHYGMFEKIRGLTSKYEMDFFFSLNIDDFEDILGETNLMPDAQNLIITGLIVPADSLPKGEVIQSQSSASVSTAYYSQTYCGYETAFDIGRELQRWGFQAMVLNEVLTEKLLEEIKPVIPTGHRLLGYSVVNNAPLPQTITKAGCSQVYSRQSPQQTIENVKNKFGISAVGISSASRFDKLADQLKDAYEGQELIQGVDKAGYHVEVQPEITVSKSNFKRPSDYLPDAKSIIVLGLRIPQGAIDSCARYSCEAIGTYAFSIYESTRLATIAAMVLAKALNQQGFKTRLCFDLAGTASKLSNSRGLQDDIFSNRFAAFAAGLGRLSSCGFTIDPQSKQLMRYIAIVTDAEIPQSQLCSMELETCLDCDSCHNVCKTDAFQENISFELEGVSGSLRRIDTNRCEWAKRYSFIPEEGNAFMGWNFQVEMPEKITSDKLAEAMKKTPPIVKHHACNFESCVMACPLVRKQES